MSWILLVSAQSLGGFEKSPKLYIKTLVLKEVCRVSLRYAESLSLAYFCARIPKSTIHYWEMRHGDIVKRVLRMLFKLLSLIEYDYSIIDSTRSADLVRELHELFINVRVKGGGTLSPVHAKLTGSEVEFIKGIAGGVGFMFGDEAFDAKPVLNTITSKRLYSNSEEELNKPGRIWSKDKR